MIEDDRASVDLTPAYLDGLGVDVVIARDGEEGLSAVRGHVPAAVLLDIRSPRIDGWEVLTRLRADARPPPPSQSSSCPSLTSGRAASEPEEVMGVLSEYHAVLGELIDRYEGTLERFTGDGVMVFFNDPFPINEPARGNALVDVAGIADLAGDMRRAAIVDRLEAMRPELEDLTAGDMLDLLETRHGIIEERIVGEEILSPSVQLRVLPDRTIELLSTHDQLLGGPSGQRYLGCVFPADPAYSRLISEPALAVARRLAEMGVRGRFALDFVVVGCRRRVVAVGHRAESAQGRYHASLPHAAVPHRRPL